MLHDANVSELWQTSSCIGPPPSPAGRLRMARRPPQTHIWIMSEPREPMTFRRVPLESIAGADSRLGATIAERLAMLRALSDAAWAATGRPFPSYERERMPIRLLKLSDVDERR